MSFDEYNSQKCDYIIELRLDISSCVSGVMERRTSLYIGEISKRTGASPKAIRLYEKLGLLTEVRREGSYRVYNPEDVEFVKLIKQAQLLGVSLSELKKLVVGRNQLDWYAVIDLLEHKRQQVDAEINALKDMNVRIHAYRSEIEACLKST